jgi:hypothetical protein
VQARRQRAGPCDQARETSRRRELIKARRAQFRFVARRDFCAAQPCTESACVARPGRASWPRGSFACRPAPGAAAEPPLVSARFLSERFCQKGSPPPGAAWTYWEPFVRVAGSRINGLSQVQILPLRPSFPLLRLLMRPDMRNETLRQARWAVCVILRPRMSFEIDGFFSPELEQFRAGVRRGSTMRSISIGSASIC